ncbi:hypothetical protein D1632_09515 [Chryseobacterium nematophagum]|uniref:RiboL-PSP-HEPN domain-containing protein n=1 Tax=Chryseobacterium nematophagum TaxID=2305228 RepID=A0A3M7LAP6_9FLAO|nr:hypothetical protein [Chryseobacterium nematophagum]RMZ59838.1 hypothetical protein D1632_09515 [Chryseobacterium nematophagum]
MHKFSELVYRSTSVSLERMKEWEFEVMRELQKNGSSIAVKNLQMIKLHKAIIAIGMFSLFESILQNAFGEESYAFEEAKKRLGKLDKVELNKSFKYFNKAINVLKHGKGRSYDFLVENSNSLPFRIQLPNEAFFNEGDVSEVVTLIDVDDRFVLDCAKLIEDISNELKI